MRIDCFARWQVELKPGCLAGPEQKEKITATPQSEHSFGCDHHSTMVASAVCNISGTTSLPSAPPGETRDRRAQCGGRAWEMIIHGRGFLPPAPEHCDSGNELAPATKVGKAEGAISRLQQKLQLEYRGGRRERRGEQQTFEDGPPPPAVSCFRPIKSVRRPPPRAWASKPGKLEPLWVVVYALLDGFPRVKKKKAAHGILEEKRDRGALARAKVEDRWV